MSRAYIAIGSNIDPESNILEGLRKLRLQAGICGISMFYRSEPLERPEQPFYINGVAAIESSLPPAGIKWGILRKIESDLGRRRGEDSHSSRTIDLDLIIYEDLVLKSNDLVIPDPGIYTRPFIAIPLFELAPRLILPDTRRSLGLIVRSMDDHALQPLRRFTEAVKKEIGHEP